MHLKTHKEMQQWCFSVFRYSLANPMTNLVKIFTGLLMYAHVGIHQERILIFGNCQNVLVHLTTITVVDEFSSFLLFEKFLENCCV